MIQIPLSGGVYYFLLIAACWLSIERSCPPEDSGGTLGYARILEVFSTPRHPEKSSFREWLGLGKSQNWDADYCNLAEINKRLSLLAYD